MIVYNVTCNVDEKVHNEWMKWMKEEHLPEVMETGMFVEHNMYRLMTRQYDEKGITYCIQYTCETYADYDRYQTEFGPALKQKTLEKFGDKVLAIRTLMESV